MKMSKKLMAYAMSFGVLFLTIFSGLPISHAETYGYLTGNEVRLRRTPTTSEDNIVKYLDKGDYVILENTNLVSGAGCDEGWYKVSSGSEQGYICSRYISLTDDYQPSYQRPWSSPKKAILGGAEFIADGYISAGQFTSYLKKFNVNPNGHYAVNNHQYQANLAAPCSEAYKTYVSYRDNGLLSYELNFTIPIFKNMPKTTKHPTDSKPKSLNFPVEDQEFEKKLDAQGFDETYKVWIRALHKAHPNWTFTSLQTNLDFGETVKTQKNIDSIEKSSCSQCVDPMNRQTESGWYIATDATVEYYLDPRNFIDEDSIFMFEDLVYHDYFQESMVKSVLANSFMSGNDRVDNIPYSSMFMEAGKKFNVNPVYLASLSRIEVGSSMGTVTSGNRFTYKGITYEGFYNFYNIGAYSGEENPALAGLVYASAGTRKNGEGIYVGNLSENTSPSNGNTQNQNSNASQLVNDLGNKGLKIKNNFITNIAVNTTSKELKSKINLANITIKKSNGSALGDTEIVTTGCTIKFDNNLSYTIIIYGDISEDGLIDLVDLQMLKMNLLGKQNLSSIQIEASKVIDKNKAQPDISDLQKIKFTLLNKDYISQE